MKRSTGLLLCAALARADPSPTAPIEGVIGRVLGDGFVPAFALSIVPAANADWCPGALGECVKVAKVAPTTSTTAGQATVALTATSANSLAYGLGMYLRTTCNASITWAATVRDLPCHAHEHPHHKYNRPHV